MELAQPPAPPSEFTEMAEHYYVPLRRFAGSLSRCRARAEDLAHQTILLYAQRGWQIRDRAKVRQWLFTTLWREHLREVRRGARTVPCADLDLCLPEGEISADASIGDARELRAVLATLAPRWREALRLRYFENLSYREMAAALGVPVGTVMSRLCRARRALREALEQRARPAGHPAHPRAKRSP